ncbi:hypothetical protein CFK37_07095 [Virgibacillus phasianinus]|uniref:Uncharacterized protein n=1 Tax=Virgibacillus phasianinus TaxID=2017483 RepID=A0A220U275_9BACI|nr:hypothetical protein [Virgibacillus phasianinus]ASK61941.1 hypothetical protein CFK37_07095 [Virgibacillus phasianinus]
MSDTKKSIERGQSITFRVPSDTPDHILKLLQKLKETERRNFSSKIAQYVLKGVNETYSRERETLTIPLPKQLTKAQKSWIKHEHSEALIGTILYQLLSDPMRATSLFSSLNNGMSGMDESIYEMASSNASEPEPPQKSATSERLGDINLDDMQEDIHAQSDDEKEVELDDDPLGDFFASMNK